MNHQSPPVAVQQTTVIQVGSQKSVPGAVLLALFFGPLGMIYATVPGALIMFFINIFVAIVTLGLGLLLTLPICAIWAGVAASSHNKRLGFSSQQAAMAGHAAPAGWHPDPAGSGRLRYYDGIRWTDHYAQADPQPPPTSQAVQEPPQLEQPAAAEAEAVKTEPEIAEEVETAVASEQVEPEVATEEAATEVVDPGSDQSDSEALTEVAPSQPEQVFCGSCGAGMSPAARFCSACGESQAVA
jgi:hypothetical protein